MLHLKLHCLVVVVVLSSCTNQRNSKSTGAALSPPPVDSTVIAATREVDKDSILLKRNRDVLATIKNRAYKSFSDFIHPRDGIRFSPYGHISDKDVILSEGGFILSLKKNEKLYWGTYAGSGDSILLTVEQYFERFIYDVDFLNAETTTINSTEAKGNSINNHDSFYKKLSFTEHYFSGFDKKYAGMDWRALRLIFKEDNGIYFIVGLVHDEWTP